MDWKFSFRDSDGTVKSPDQLPLGIMRGACEPIPLRLCAEAPGGGLVDEYHEDMDDGWRLS